ncbi:glycoside hydrolase family 12 protein [Boletus coccyginus]|nr:glycoside hydrolase family 12 protein [Boletus coccyginus]
MIYWSVLLLLLSLVSASPLECSAQTACGQFDTITSGSYSLLTDLWGVSAATCGSQCSTLECVNGNTVKWSTEWTWSCETGVKSFSNIQLNVGINQQLSAISTMHSTWHWTQSSSESVVADVAYDLFTSHTAGGSNVNEVMIWLANFNAGPLAYKYSDDGQAVSTASNLTIAGHCWDFYWGSNGYNEVYSFLPVTGAITSFRGDIFEFLTYLIDNEYITPSEYLVTAQAGTEASCGNAVLNTCVLLRLSYLLVRFHSRVFFFSSAYKLTIS